MRWIFAAVLALASPLTGGCSDDDRPPPKGLADRPPPPNCAGVGELCQARVANGELPETERSRCESDELELCANAYFFSGFDSSPLPRCNPADAVTPIRETVATQLFRGTGIQDQDVALQTRSLQRYFEPHELFFTAPALSAPYPLTYAMRGSEGKLSEALEAAGIPLDRELTADEEQAALDVTGEVIFGGLRGFLREHAQTAQVGVNIAVIYDIVEPSLKPLLDIQGEVVGLGLSPALLQRVSEDEQNASIYDLLQVGTEFMPTLLVGHRTIVRLLRYPDAIIAHEMGHALGLPHVDISGNLMQPVAQSTCRGSLLDEQIALMGPFQAQLGEGACGHWNVRTLHRRILRQLYARHANGQSASAAR